jgi:hypothetical protein
MQLFSNLIRNSYYCNIRYREAFQIHVTGNIAPTIANVQRISGINSKWQ